MEAEETVEAEQFFPIHLAIMLPGTLAPVDLHLRDKATGRFVLYKNAQAPLNEETRDRLMEHGVDALYLRKEDEQAYNDYVEQNISAIIRDDLLPVEKASELVYNSSAHVMHDVFDNPRSGRNLQRTHAMSEAMVLSIIKNPDALWHMTAMASHDYYTYTHCVNVSLFLVAVSRDALGITDAMTLQRIGLGGMLHDIGKTQIPEEILSKPGKLTDEEFEQIRQHPLLGLDIVKDYRKLSPSAATIIRCHHEHFNGSGYPNALVGERIDPLARLANIADVYDALTTHRAYAPARKPYEALKTMLVEMQDEFDVPMLRLFVKFLGPKGLQMDTGAEP